MHSCLETDASVEVQAVQTITEDQVPLVNPLRGRLKGIALPLKTCEPETANQMPSEVTRKIRVDDLESLSVGGAQRP